MLIELQARVLPPICFSGKRTKVAPHRQFGLGILRCDRPAMRQDNVILQKQGFVDGKMSPMTCQPIRTHFAIIRGRMSP